MVKVIVEDENDPVQNTNHVEGQINGEEDKVKVKNGEDQKVKVKNGDADVENGQVNDEIENGQVNDEIENGQVNGEKSDLEDLKLKKTLRRVLEEILAEDELKRHLHDLSKDETLFKSKLQSALKQPLDKVQENEKPQSHNGQPLEPRNRHSPNNVTSSISTNVSTQTSTEAPLPDMQPPNLTSTDQPKQIVDVEHQRSGCAEGHWWGFHSQPLEKVEEAGANMVIKYFKKMKGGRSKPRMDHPVEALQSFIVSFVGTLVIAMIDHYLLIDGTPYLLVIGSFGATAVLVFCAIKSPLAQPRNVIFGHVISAIIGVGCQYSLGRGYPWLAASLAVSISIAVMSLTNTVHPPGGATALIAVYSNEKIHNLGLWYVLIPVTVGAVALLIVALVMNNLFPSRRYPTYWL